MKRMGVVALRAAAVCLGLIIPLLGWEVIAWLWPPRHLMDNPWYTFTGEALMGDNDLPFVRPPHLRWTGLSRGDLAVFAEERDPDAHVVTFHTDALGFRNSCESTRASIVFVGDSYTEAGNVQEAETFAERTGKRLGRTVRNLGQARQCPPGELIILQKFGLGFRPKTVVWQISEPNDLPESIDFRAWEQSGKPRYVPGGTKAVSRGEAWKRRSLVWRLARSIGASPWPLSGLFCDAKGRSQRFLFLPMLPGSPQSPVGNNGWPIVAEAIEQGASILKQQNIQLVVVLVPMKLRVMADYIKFDEMSLEIDGRTYKLEGHLPEGWDLAPDATLASYLAGLCERLGIGFVDSTDKLKMHAARGEAVFFPKDTHLSASGHRIVSDLIIDALNRNPSTREDSPMGITEANPPHVRNP